ncbi:hypothetical protein EYF80_020250 [Liparis tanakae]|uniref:Uncharacterized protein n=1 Tax=Liparis tanakae TaxID=230148 RepID=A0A4Z2HWB2_9TELE|nr:hypothetical protein EYF80_020250 [Liparis tanakae]
MRNIWLHIHEPDTGGRGPSDPPADRRTDPAAEPLPPQTMARRGTLWTGIVVLLTAGKSRLSSGFSSSDPRLILVPDSSGQGDELPSVILWTRHKVPEKQGPSSPAHVGV